MNISVIISVNVRYTDRHIRRHFGLMAQTVLWFSLTIIRLHNDLESAIRLNLIEAVK